MQSSEPVASRQRDAEGSGIEAVLRCGWPARMLLRVMPHFRGSGFLGAMVAGLFPAGHRRGSLALSIAGTTVEITLDLADPVQFAMAARLGFDLMTARVVASALGDGDTFVDVGANWGYFTCIGASRVGTTGLVLAIEPSRVANRRLQETVRRHRFTNVIVVQYAAGSAVGREVSVVRPFYRQTTGSYIQDRRPGPPPDTVTTTLDALREKIASPVRLIKVDTEGAELPVMRGAASLLDRDRPLVILEASRYCQRFGYTVPQLYDYMRGHGYTSAYRVDDDVRHMALSGPLAGAQEGQILFQHEQSPVRLTTEEIRAHVSIG